MTTDPSTQPAPSAEGLNRREIALLGAVAVATAAAGIAHYADADPLLAFGLATIALSGMAWIVSFATEQVGERFGPAVTGVLQSTLGNLPEFFIVIFALSKGHTVVAQTSIIGSIFANALLVLGIVIVVGAKQSEDGIMRFHPRLPNDTATLLLVASFIMVVTGVSLATDDHAAKHVDAISAIGAVAILGVYLAWVIPYVRSEPGTQAPAAGAAGGRIPLLVSATLLTIAGAGAAFVSDWFIAALEPAIKQLGVSEAFAGLVVVAIAGNAVENATGVVLAYKGQSDLAISVVKNSVSQIAAFLFPALVLVSLLFASTLTFALAPVYIAALIIMALVVWQVTGDGEAAAFEGWALIAVYVMLAALTLYE
jgi:Ca2+:H+ antiporter